MKYAITLLLFFAVLCTRGQINDSISQLVKTYPERIKKLTELSERINEDFQTDKSKAQAIYYWVGNHIAYDVELASKKHKKVKHFRHRTKAELNRKLEQYDAKIIDRTLRKGKATCNGYSRLYRKLCNLTGLQCQLIGGYARTGTNEIGIFPFRGRHAWNKVYFDGSWHLVEATWSAGFVDPPVKRFYPDYTDAYFDIPPQLFYTSHFCFTKNKAEQPISKSDFIKLPLIYARYFDSENIAIDSLPSGVIDKIENNRIRFRLKTSYRPIELDFRIDGKSFTKEAKVERNGNYLEIEIPCTQKKGFLSVLYRYDPILTFKIKNTGKYL